MLVFFVTRKARWQQKNSLTRKIYHKTFNKLYILGHKLYIYLVKKKSKELKIWIFSIIITRAMFKRNSYSFKISNLPKRHFFMNNYHLDSNQNFNHSSNTKKNTIKWRLNCVTINVLYLHSMHISPFVCIGNLQRSFFCKKKNLLTTCSRRIS